MEKWLESIYTDGSRNFISNPHPKKGEKIKVSLRTLEDSPIQYVILRTKLNGIEIPFTMNRIKSKNGLSYYESPEITLYEDVFHYHFFIVTKDRIFYYNQMGIQDYLPDETYDFKILVDYDAPSWVSKSVFYQIFPDRFYNGNKGNDVKDGEYVFDGHKTSHYENWNTIPKEYDDGFCLDFYGGDLEGIKEKIPYLKHLGVNAIYVNPIFYAATVHRYDCLDYFNVDPHLGGNEALIELIEELHKNDMRLIIDVSINHTGTANKWFNKNAEFFPKEVGAFNNPNSPERDYYFFNEKNEYASWFGTPTLPTLNYTSSTLRKMIFDSPDCLVKKWIKAPYNADGWRFDVADVMARNNEYQLHHDVWPKIRKAIKEEKSDAYILAEDWADCAEFLNGNEWDSSMNYFGFTRPVRQFVGQQDLFQQRNPLISGINPKMTAREFVGRVSEHLFKLSFAIQENQFNLLDSHDVSRLHNDPNINLGDYRGAVIMLFTFPGTPSIYYGDEANIDGTITTNEGCRYPFPWDCCMSKKSNYELYRKLAHLKLNEDTLQTGGIKFLSSCGYTLCYARIGLKKTYVVVFSTDDKETTVEIPYQIFGYESLSIREVFDMNVQYNLHDELEINVPPHTCYLLELEEQK